MRSRKKRRSSRRRQRRRSLLKQERLQRRVEAWRKPGDGSYSGAKNNTQASLHTLKLWRNKLHPSEVFMVKGSFRLI